MSIRLKNSEIQILIDWVDSSTPTYGPKFSAAFGLAEKIKQHKESLSTNMCCDCLFWENQEDDPTSNADTGTCDRLMSPFCGTRTPGDHTCEFVCIEVNVKNCK